MIRVELADEPATFDDTVRRPGLLAIAEMVGECPNPLRQHGKPIKYRAASRAAIKPDKFPPYWRLALKDMMEKYHQICAYSCFRIHTVTGAGSVDHMVPKSRSWENVYEWKNYRLACSRLNSLKLDFGDVLDPFDIRDGWFQLELVGFQVNPDRKLSKPLQMSIQNTINRLHLNDPIPCRQREDAAEEYLIGRDNQPLPLWKLEKESPFVAMELRRQGRLRDGDV